MISEFRKPEYKRYSLDIVNAVANLPFLDPDEAKSMEFTIEYFKRRNQKFKEVDERTSSQISEDFK